jgi:hypothetical protein
MKRTMCGLFLAAAAGLLACSGDPTGDLVGKDLTIQADPSSLFIPLAGSAPVNVSVIDVQGNTESVTDLAFNANSGSLSVVEDSTFQPTVAGPLSTTRRLIVTANTPDSGSIHVSANGVAKDIPVVVNPTGATVALSATDAPANQPITISLAGQPFKFGEGAGATIGGAAGVNLGLSADSTTMTFLPPPGAAGPLSLDSVAPVYAPSLRFSLPTGDSLTIGPLTPAPGTGSPTTAPALPIPAAGTTTGFLDIGTFTAPDLTGDGGLAKAQYYRLDVTEAGTYTFTVNWDNDADLDILLCQATNCSDADFMSAGDIQPETDSRDLVPGTYYLAVVLFAGTVPGSISIALNR